MIALLSYYSNFQVDFESMTDEQLALKWNQLLYALKKTGQYKE